MNLTADEFLSLSTQLSDRDIKVTELEKKLEETMQRLAIKEAENDSGCRGRKSRISCRTSTTFACWHSCKHLC